MKPSLIVDGYEASFVVSYLNDILVLRSHSESTLHSLLTFRLHVFLRIINGEVISEESVG